MTLALEEGLIRNLTNRVISDGAGALDAELGNFQTARSSPRRINASRSRPYEAPPERPSENVKKILDSGAPLTVKVGGVECKHGKAVLRRTLLAAIIPSDLLRVGEAEVAESGRRPSGAAS